MIFGSGLPFSQSAFDHDVDDDSILRVHADEAAAFARRRHCFEDRSIIDEEDSRIRHEQFQTRDALVDESFDFRDPIVREIRADHVEAVIDRCPPLSFRKPHVERLV